MNHYQQLNRNLDNSSGMMYDILRFELGAVRESSIGQVQELAMDHYHHVIPNLDNSLE